MAGKGHSKNKSKLVNFSTEKTIEMKSSSPEIKRKSELMEEETLKAKSSKIDQIDPVRGHSITTWTR